MKDLTRPAVGGFLQRRLEARQRDRYDDERAQAGDPAYAMLLTLTICLARLAAREDAGATR